MTDTPPVKLLIVDDEVAQMEALCATLEPQGYSTTGFSSPAEALTALREESYDLLLSDLMMPEMDGITLLHAALEIDPGLVGVLMTGHGTIDTAVQAMQTGALDYILKPFKLSAILPVISRALAVRRLRAENIQLHEAVGIYKLSMAISSASAKATVLQQVADAAMANGKLRDMSVLLPSPEGDELYVAVTAGKDSKRPGDRIPFDARCELFPRHDEVASSRFVSSAPLPGPDGAMSIPMLAGGKFIGILNFSSVSPRGAAPGQIKALNILASAAASALDRVALVEQLRGAEQRYRRLAENAPDIVFRYDLDPQPGFVYVSPVVKAITGYSPEEHYADPNLCMRIVYPEDRQLMETLLNGGNPGGGSAVAIRYLHREGHVIRVEHRTIPVHDLEGRLVAVEGIARDITGRGSPEKQLHHSQ
jgi:PAS domain S-box-containing protein